MARKATQLSFRVTVPYIEGVSADIWQGYIESAVTNWSGQSHPPTGDEEPDEWWLICQDDTPITAERIRNKKQEQADG